MGTATVQPIDQSEERAKTINRIGQLQEKIKAELARLAPDKKELSELLSQVESWYANHPPEDPDCIETTEFLLKVTPCEYEREIFDPVKAYRALKLTIKEFLTKKLPKGKKPAVKIPLGLIDAIVPEEKQLEFLTKERTGSRTYEVLRIPPKQAA